MLIFVIIAAIFAVCMLIYDLRSVKSGALSAVWVNGSILLVGAAGYVFAYIYTRDEIVNITSEADGIAEIFGKVSLWLIPAVLIFEEFLILSALLSPGVFRLRHALNLFSAVLLLFACGIITVLISENQYYGNVCDGECVLLLSVCALFCTYPLTEELLILHRAGYTESMTKREEIRKKRKKERAALKSQMASLGRK